MPFQRSASITSMPVTMVKNPAAMQGPWWVHETPTSCKTVAARGMGTRSIDQRAPFQRSASALPAPARSMKNPTATHEVDDAQDTPERNPTLIPAGWGVCWTVQATPFHRSLSMTPAVPAALPEEPTATQDVGDRHDTAPR